MCCGNKRAQLRNSLAPRSPQSAPQSAPASRQVQFSPPAAREAVSTYHRTSPQSRSVQLSAAATGSTQPSVVVRYLDADPVRIQGLVTGRFYDFSSARQVQSVDAGDASSLLNTRSFQRA